MVRTGCPYCGVGCGLVAEVRDGRLHAVRGDEEHPVNRGLTCRKPLALPEASRLISRPSWNSTETTWMRTRLGATRASAASTSAL